MSSPCRGENAWTSSRNAARFRLRRRRRRHVQVRVELGEDARPPDDLAQELTHRTARFDPERRQLLAALLEARPALVGDPLDLVEVLEGLCEQEGGRLALGFVLLAEGVALVLCQRGDQRQVLEADPIPRSQQDPAERDAGQRVERRAA